MNRFEEEITIKALESMQARVYRTDNVTLQSYLWYPAALIANREMTTIPDIHSKINKKDIMTVLQVANRLKPNNPAKGFNDYFKEIYGDGLDQLIPDPGPFLKK